MRPSAIALLCALFLLVCSGVARADGISMPSTCPPGSQADGCHWSGYCSVLGCTDDSDCSGGRTCQDIEHCMGTVGCSSNPRDPEAGTYSRPTVLGVCGEGESCSGECETHRVCADSGEPDFVGEGGCECRAGGRGQGTTAALISLCIAAIALVRLRSAK